MEGSFHRRRIGHIASTIVKGKSIVQVKKSSIVVYNMFIIVNCILPREYYNRILYINLDPEIIVTVDGKSIDMLTAFEYSKLFSDNDMAIETISKELRESNLFQFNWKDVNRSSITVSCTSKDCAVVVVAWEHATRLGNITNILKIQGWLLKQEQQIRWKMWDWLQGDIYGQSKEVLSKSIQAGQALSFDRPGNDLPLSIFVVQGWFEFINFTIFINL